MCKKEKETKNLISKNLLKYRLEHNYSQRKLAYLLQLNGIDMDRNIITRIETNQRYVKDIEVKALCEIFHITYQDLMD